MHNGFMEPNQYITISQDGSVFYSNSLTGAPSHDNALYHQCTMGQGVKSFHKPCVKMVRSVTIAGAPTPLRALLLMHDESWCQINSSPTVNQLTRCFYYLHKQFSGNITVITISQLQRIQIMLELRRVHMKIFCHLFNP